MGFIWSIIIGIVAGYLAGKIMRGGGFGVIVNLILGIIGGVLGGWVFSLLGISAGGILGSLITSTVGAILLVLPAAKIAASLITMFPNKSMERETYEEMKKHSEGLLSMADLVVTSKDQVVNLAYTVIVDGNVYAYTEKTGQKLNLMSKHIETILKTNQCRGNVKILIISPVL